MAYLELDPEGDGLHVALLENHSKGTLLPDLVRDDDAQRGAGENQQQQQRTREPLAGGGHPIAFWLVLAPIHHIGYSLPQAARFHCRTALFCFDSAMWRGSMELLQVHLVFPGLCLGFGNGKTLEADV